MRRGRLGHCVAAAVLGSIWAQEINRAVWNRTAVGKAGASLFAAVLLFFFIVPRLRFALADEKPLSVLCELGVGRPRRLDVWIPVALGDFLEPGERLEVAAVVVPGRWRTPRFLGLTDRRLILVKTLPPGLLPVRIDVEALRRDVRVVDQSAVRLGASQIVIELGGGRRIPLIFSRRFASQARRIEEGLSSSDRA